MSKTLSPITATRTERTLNVVRYTPYGGEYRLSIDRQIVTKDADGNVIAEEVINNAYNEPAEKTMQRQSSFTYLLACQQATSILDLLNAESAFYDNLVDEIDSENQPQVL